MPEQARHREELAQLIESAERLGVEIDETEALQWLTAMAAKQPDEHLVMDMSTGVFGHRVTMLDFSPGELERFREIGRLVEIEDEPGVVETALALSGSAAQSRIQSYPGDADYFERVNIIAPTREEACAILARVLREKILSTAGGPDHRFIEVKFGSYPFDVRHGDRDLRAGAPIAWSVEEVRAGKVEVTRSGGTPATITWDEAGRDPGWCKLDWVVADTIRHRLANASNMLDVTWEGPDGTIVPLDGQLDPYFQEVYLEASSIPIFSKIAKHVLPDALDDYVTELEREVARYVHREPNYGKAAKRMYNVFRLSGRYPEAVYIRELFDEPTTILYQVAAVIRTVDEAAHTDSAISIETLLAQTDGLMEAVEHASETMHDEDVEQVQASLVWLRGHLEEGGDPLERVGYLHAARERVEAAVNHYFEERLFAVPTIREYVNALAS
jgi:hypothetical protein